jgi:hypothetical protein
MPQFLSLDLEATSCSKARALDARALRVFCKPPTSARAVRILAEAPRGLTLSAMLDNGFTEETIGSLVRDGLATKTTERVRVGGQTTEVERVRITNAGMLALIP